MADIYLNSKPVSESFAYAYVEDSDGKLVRIALDDMKLLLGSGYVDGEITVVADSWVESENGEYFTQSVAVPNATVNSRIDLDPSPEQIIQLINESVSMFISNENGAIKAYALGSAPSTDMTFKIRISEVA